MIGSMAATCRLSSNLQQSGWAVFGPWPTSTRWGSRISASGLTDEARQMTLDLDGGSGGAAPSVGAWSEVSGTLDAIRDRFGAAAIGPATLVRPGQGLKVTRRGEQQWGPTEPGPTASAGASVLQNPRDEGQR